MGLLNTDPAVRLNATFSPVYPPAGSVAMSTQSGALGLAILDYAQQLEHRHLELRVGRQQGRRLGQRPDSVLGRRSAHGGHPAVPRELRQPDEVQPRSRGASAARKPIVAVKAGPLDGRARAPRRRTPARWPSSDAVVDALFRQAGVIRTETLEELFDVATLLAHQPVPRGPPRGDPDQRRRARHPGRRRLRGARPRAAGAAATTTRAELRAFLPAAASVGNPVDMLASAPPEHYRRALAALLRDERVDSVIAIFIPPLVTEADEVAAAIADGRRAARTASRSLGVFMRAEGAPAALGADSVLRVSRIGGGRAGAGDRVRRMAREAAGHRARRSTASIAAAIRADRRARARSAAAAG